MLINFSVENFRSFGQEQTLNLVASKAQKGHEDHCIEILETGQQVLRTGIIYGANAAGKSNLVGAIGFAQALVLHGASPMKRIALNQFRFSNKAAHPSSFEFRFLASDQLFVYGFDVTADAVVAEWLDATNEQGKETEVFSRTGQEISIGELTKFGEAGEVSSEALKALKLLGTRPNQLLLNKVVDLDQERQGNLLNKVVRWFSACLTVIEPEAGFGPMLEYLDEDTGFKEFASEFLSEIGTGIGDLGIEQTEIKAENLPNPIVESLQSLNEVESTAVALGPGMSLRLKQDDPSTVIRRNLSTQHKVGADTYPLSFAEESDGTQRFLHLLPALYHLQNSDNVYIIDELDRSLHPLLSHAMLKFFVEVCPRVRQQLIVTTHETHLLDLDLLRRDEIWFAEKDKQQQTRLYSLVDMKVRKDLRIEKSYLQGRFGAIPFLGGTERLRDRVNSITEE